MEEYDDKIIQIIKGITIGIIFVIVGLFCLLFIGVKRVDALEVRPTTCVSASDDWNTENCSVNEKTINNSNYVNVVTTYPSGLQEKTYNFSLYYDLYVKERSSLVRVNEYVKTPIVHVYIGTTEINSQAPTIIQTQRSWCDNGPCWRIRTFLTNFQWRGNLSNQSITWNIRSATGSNGIIGWTDYSGVGVANLNGPYFQYGQSFAEYNDDTQQAVENQTSQMQEGFANINENNNRLTESVNETITNKTDEVKDAIEKQNLKCENYNYTESNITLGNGKLNSNGDVSLQNNWYYTTQYISINSNKTYTITTQNYTIGGTAYCLYGSDKSLIQCISNTNNSNIITITPQVEGYIRFNLQQTQSGNLKTTFTGEYCYNLLEKQNETQQQQNDYLMDPSVDSSSINGFNASVDYGGVSGVIIAPLQAIQSILSNTCSDLVLPLPFINENLTLPCLTPIYQRDFSTILTLYQTIITGIVAYWICLNIFHMIHGFTDPTDDKIEVVDL